MNNRPNLKDFHLRWAGIRPPLRPHESVARAIRALCAGRACTALQLGVTPEIANLCDEGIAIDWSEQMLHAAWPGDTPAHKALVGDWLAMPLADGCTNFVFGDGCLTVIEWPHQYTQFFDEVSRVLRPGGRLVLRCFAGPEEHGSMKAFVAAAFAGAFPSFSAFKLRFNMQAFHVANGSLTNGMFIHQLFQLNFPDRAALSSAAGWSVDEIAGIDAYRDSISALSYPTRQQLAALLETVRAHFFVETEGYPMAELCPLLVVDF